MDSFGRYDPTAVSFKQTASQGGNNQQLSLIPMSENNDFPVEPNSDLAELNSARDSKPEILVPEPTDIVVGERAYPWPENTPRFAQGNLNSKPNLAFSLWLNLLRRLTPAYEWIPFYKDNTGANSLGSFDSLFETINTLFQHQLQANFSYAQKALLDEADVVLVCYDPDKDTILSYGSTRFSERGSIPGIKQQVNHAGHMIVAVGNERKQLAPLTAVTMALYGHTFLDLFREEIVILRTNNRYIERLFGRVQPVYRSDHLNENESDERLKCVISAMKWTDKHVFHSETELKVGSPVKISHRFLDEVTIDGVKGDEIIYLARMSSIGFYLLRIALSVFRRKRRR